MGYKGKKVIQKESVTQGKIPKNIVNPDSYLSKNPTWAFAKCDREKWSITKADFGKDILEKLMSFEGLTWGQIQAASGGRSNGTNNHFENVSDLSKDAQNRIHQLHLDIDQVFSLRLTNTTRLYGILENGVFNILWYDQKHEIYKCTLKHS